MSNRLPPQFEVTIEKMSHQGCGVGRFGNRSVCVYGVMVGERVLVRPVKKNRREVSARLIEILTPHPERRVERESHYLSCSPWQIIPENRQREYKLDFVRRLFSSNLYCLPAKELEIVASEASWSYRNKMEFSFTVGENGDVSLAFHERGRYWAYYELDSCVLACNKINICAQNILRVINEKKITPVSLKNLLVRYSYAEDKCLASLYVVDMDFLKFDTSDNDLVGWQIIYSDPTSPSTVTTEILHKQGREYLYENIGGVRLKYYCDSFFQINPPAFEKALDYVRKNVRGTGILVDLYSGVGTIGFSLAQNFQKVISVEFDARAVEAARESLVENKLDNVELFSGAAEKQDLDEILQRADCLIVDPPRGGMHPKVIKKILKYVPKHFVYVSCNPATQSQDFQKLREKYKVKAWRLFDFYPQTPHVESVMVMELKNVFDGLGDSLKKFFSR